MLRVILDLGFVAGAVVEVLEVDATLVLFDVAVDLDAVDVVADGKAADFGFGAVVDAVCADIPTANSAENAKRKTNFFMVEMFLM